MFQASSAQSTDILFRRHSTLTGSNVNIMAAVTYQLLHGTMSLQPTYIQLQMADQTFRNVEDKYDPPIIHRRPFLSTVKAIIYIGTGEVHMHFPTEKVRHYFTDPNYIVEDSKQVKTRRRQHNRNQRRQIIKDRWADYAIQRIPGRLRKRRVPFGGLINTERLAKR